ncbi:Uncharacterized protein YeaC [Choanephora cucurbitarum]|uniref:magnesium chelatase n=1 Tax=Choanephora cucurbitarum TaxID=101091 RepID=A0A1C7NLN3_9FUNG|nr:Uncharacterized protein YeaC [Choanephora cucurbitarum]
MTQDHREWIKTRMAILKRQAGFSFNQDLFISILLCLISGKDKHLILTAPPDRLAEVSQMATLISRYLFGFTVAKLICREGLTKNDLVETLFNSKEDIVETAPQERQHKTRSRDSSIFSHPPSQSIQTVESENAPFPSSEKSVNSKFPGDNEFVSPVSPVDFNLRKRQPFMIGSPNQKEKYDRARWIEIEDSKRPFHLSHSARLAQTLIVQNLESSDAVTQALLLELISTKELRISNIKYNLPKPFFLVIAVLPQGYNRLSISSQLVDRFFIGYNFEYDMFTASNTNNHPLRPPSMRRFALIKQEEIKTLAEKANHVHVHIDIMRYIRDIAVSIRTHPRVKGGLTARCSKDLVTVTKSLATLFERDFLTPDLVTIAAEKVFGHRLHILAENARDDQMEREDMDVNIPSDIIAEILRVIYVPV